MSAVYVSLTVLGVAALALLLVMAQAVAGMRATAVQRAAEAREQMARDELAQRRRSRRQGS